MELLSKLHPLVIHFPIAFFLLYIILEIFNLFSRNITIKKTSLFILLLGLIGGILSVLTGNQAFQEILNNSAFTQMHNLIIEQHEYYATLTVWYFFVIFAYQIFAFLKNKNEVKKQYIFVLFATVGIFLIYQTAKIGGRLVYELGIGTELLK